MSVAEFFYALLRNVILPPGLFFLPILVGLLLRLRFQRTGNTIAALALSLLYIACTSAGSRLLVEPLEARTQALTDSSNTGAQAIVVLSAGSVVEAPEYGGQNIPDYLALGRLRYAAHLHHKTGLPVLTSGGNSNQEKDDPSKADEMAVALREDFGVPVQWTESRSRTTQQNAMYSVEILRQHGVRRILLVTDAMHMPRAAEVFSYYGIEVVQAPTLFFGRSQIGPLHFLPGPEGLRRSWYASYEWIGLFWYRWHMHGSLIEPALEDQERHIPAQH